LDYALRRPRIFDYVFRNADLTLVRFSQSLQFARQLFVFSRIRFLSGAHDKRVKMAFVLVSVPCRWKSIEDRPLCDTALIANGNLVEHYEIAMYRSLAAFARHLGFKESATLLQETLAEEKNADAKLTQIDETAINEPAARSQAA
jgi:hypothetical protein